MYQRLFIYSPIEGHLGTVFCVVKAARLKRLHAVGFFVWHLGRRQNYSYRIQICGWQGLEVRRRMDFKGGMYLFPRVTTYHKPGYLKPMSIISSFGEFLRWKWEKCYWTLEKKKDDPCYKAAVPNFLAPGTGFMEDSFSMDRGWGGWFRR